MKVKYIIVVLLCFFSFFFGCKPSKKEKEEAHNAPQSEISVAQEKKIDTVIVIDQPLDVSAPEGMVWITGGAFKQGAVANDQMAMQHEKPSFPVKVSGFFMDINEVTNADFKKFVDATGYVTVAESAIEWQELKKQLPANTPKPHDSIMQPGSLIFKKTKTSVPNLYDFSQWWEWKIGANWKQPNGPGSSIKGKDNHPVVHIAYNDALAYCKWAGRRLPTEAEWERAARGNENDKIFTWGDDISMLSKMANTWEGEFPVNNTLKDGFELRGEVKSYPPNSFGLYDMAGNVWEWTNDWYNSNHYKEISKSNEVFINPIGASSPFNERDIYAREKIVKGGSFLCSKTYCASYRISARMGTSLDSSQEHLGFRTVVTPQMLKK